MQRLKQKYNKEISKKLASELNIKNFMAIPKPVKVVVNMGIGDTLKDKSLLEAAIKELSDITGQKPSIRTAKISVASFGIRRGMNVGLKTTLRGDRMYAFLDKLFSIVLPRFRDFRGVPLKSFDKVGNYTLGIVEHNVFPEIDITKSRSRGLEITIVTNANNPEVSKKLLEYLEMPFEKI
ncbi:MAG: 50S ribosomal protein L5 [Candidatus Woesebacteria bacterium GW2011_GWA1_37_8]|uniref:Large ribosomal subunit protein uL5 n=2 Tax=Candidatus Woeseibacteriota TaxID=1752722 RepID=A0A0G0LIG1_9BACT|nr:MAG: 50S ribosomal protein L5 [Microgenomates group bacterium GW2011_GWC1_37_12b]KKQ45873.1 MAG: 50S ribosomal protein L5 [Candidatus Woesebacteria bacterium GW2011_GWA1_37_8]KKQ87705.1 MAG: 50S ribosomal protein L5 [Candidatus Woesebacteria bacterium GW2011_GWB1_38_8b]